VLILGTSGMIGNGLPVSFPKEVLEEGGCCHLATLPYALVSFLLAFVRQPPWMES
jgi:hypothetical protein